MSENDRRPPIQRAAALILAVLLLLLFAATLIVGVFGGPEQLGLLKALIFSDIVVPVAIYGYMLLIRHRRGK